jgi:hypothetical protein
MILGIHRLDLNRGTDGARNRGRRLAGRRACLRVLGEGWRLCGRAWRLDLGNDPNVVRQLDLIAWLDGVEIAHFRPDVKLFVLPTRACQTE